MNIVMLEPLDIPPEYLDSLLSPLRAAGHRVSPCLEPLSPTQKAETIREAEALLIANSPLGADLLALAPRLQHISVAFTGTDHLDLAYCRERGIKVSNCAGYSTQDVAELALSAMISLLRDVQQADARARAGGTKKGLRAGRLQGKTIGLIGTGAIGLRLARLLQPFGVRLLAHSRSRRPEAEALGITYLPLEEVLKQSDIVSLHTPLTAETRGLLSRERLALMKPGAFLINTARGAVVDSAALAEALREGSLAGAAIDVFEAEPPLACGHPLLQSPNTLLSPHIAYYTAESMLDRAAMAVENIEKWLQGELIREVRG